MTHIIKHALANSLLTVFYVILAGTFLFNARFIFGDIEPSVFIPIGMLLMFVFSAALCGALVLGRPILWYLDGNKKEAVSLFAYTLLFFLITGVIVFIIMWMVTR